MKWIGRLYIFFVGIILTTTVGFGIAAFYPQPQQPRYDLMQTVTVPQSCYSTPEEAARPECKTAIQQSQKEAEEQRVKQQKENIAYMEENSGYNRTAIFLGIAIGALFAILGLGLIKVSHPVSNGIILAGVLTAVLTRFIIALASLGATTGTTSGADALLVPI